MVGGHFSQCIMDNLMTLGLVTISLLLGGKFIRFQSSYEFISLLFHKFRSNMLQSIFHIGTYVLQQNVFSVDNQYHQIKNPGRLCCYLIMPLKCMSLNQLSTMLHYSTSSFSTVLSVGCSIKWHPQTVQQSVNVEFSFSRSRCPTKNFYVRSVPSSL